MWCRICWLHSRSPPRTPWWTQTKIVINYWSEHISNVPLCLSEQFQVIAKCSNKFGCLVREMFFIRKRNWTISKRANGLDLRKGIHLKNLWSFVITLICKDCILKPNLRIVYSLCLGLRVVSRWRRNVGHHWTTIFACLLLLSILLESTSNIHLMFLKGTSEKVAITYVDVESSLNRVQYNTKQYIVLYFVMIIGLSGVQFGL